MKTAIAYIRVSTDRQASEGVSLEAQQSRIEQWCKDNDYKVVQVFKDAGVSGALSIAERDGLSDALAAIKKNKADALIVTKRDRLSRDYVESGLIDRECVKMKAKVIATDASSHGDSPEEMLMRMIMDAFATHERLVIKMRTRAALQHKKATNQKYCNQTPYGFEAVDGRLIQVAQEAGVVAEIQAARVGGSTLQTIADDLNTRGVPTKTGKQWQPATIHLLLKRSKLVLTQ
jgi:site-specific DNA recombinase